MLEEYFVIQIPGVEGERDRYVGPDDQGTALTGAQRFPSVEAAERYMEDKRGSVEGNWRIQLCTREAPADSKGNTFAARLMEIPYPYRRTAYNWLRGRDVRALLLREGESVYRRHRKILRDHDVDIDRPSTVVMLKPKRPRRAINTGQSRNAGPRQFFCAPGERPTAAPIEPHKDSEDSSD